MKKYSLILLGALGLMLASCEEDLPVAKPQEVPQGPVLVAGDITTEKQGPLVSGSVDLNNYAADTESLIQVLTLTEAINLPEGTDIAFQLEISGTEDFEKYGTVYLQYGTTPETSKNLYAQVGEWNNAHNFAIGRAPKPVTVYYRIPVFLNVGDSDYRYMSVDYYAQKGSITETCIDAGLVVEDNYYFMSNATSWSFDDVTKYPFYHNPDVSVYDNPNFTFVWYQDAQVNKGNPDNWWKVAPASAVSAQDWSALFGTSENGDQSMSGILTDIDAQSGMIDKPGKYEFKLSFSYNQDTKLTEANYMIYPLADAVYMIGSPQGWNIDAANLYLEETQAGSNIYQGTIYVGAGEFSFRFYHQTGNWDLFSIGSQNADSGVDITFTDGQYSGPVFQEGVNCESGKGSWSYGSWEGGYIEFTLNLNDFTIVMKSTTGPERANIYMRGDFNSWGSNSGAQFEVVSENQWTINRLTISEGETFKVADLDWVLNLGAGADDKIVPGTPYTLVSGGGNITMTEDFYGSVTLTKSGDTYTLLLTEAEPEE